MAKPPLTSEQWSIRGLLFGTLAIVGAGTLSFVSGQTAPEIILAAFACLLFGSLGFAVCHQTALNRLSAELQQEKARQP